MGFPGEEIVTKAVETFSSSLMKKMDAAEARRSREFSLKLKELEFYKSNYDKELRQYRIMQNMPKCDILSSWISK